LALDTNFNDTGLKTSAGSKLYEVCHRRFDQTLSCPGAQSDWRPSENILWTWS